MINFKQLKEFSGLVAVGDIHGNFEDMQKAVGWALSRNYFFLSLGDLTDYGFENYECVKLMHRIIQAGDGAMIIGNHDDKMKRYLVQRRAGEIRVQVKGGMLSSVDELNAMTPDEFEDFEKKFLEIMAGAKLHTVLGNVMFVHAGATTDMWSRASGELGGKQKARALYGQIDRDVPKREDGLPNRIYNWVQDLGMHDDYNPQIAVVGHDIRSQTEPVIEGSFNGGMAFFVDTGSSKGGKLSLVPFEIMPQEHIKRDPNTGPNGPVLFPLDFKTF